MRDGGDFALVTFFSLYKVLEVLSKAEGPVGKKEIDRALGKSCRQVVNYLTHLRDLGLVRQKLRFTGRTGIQGYYSLAPRGLEALEAMKRLVEILKRDPEEPMLVITKREPQEGLRALEFVKEAWRA